MITSLLNLFFYGKKYSPFTLEEVKEFNRIYSTSVGENGKINYTSNYPKYRFIDYLISEKNYVVHGSNNKEIKVFEPRKQTLFNGEYVDAIFASKDGIWPIFYAILDRSKVQNNFRNGCIKARGNKRFYFFSLTNKTVASYPWTSGMIYFLPSEHFEQSHTATVYFDEWINKRETESFLKLEVDSKDFEFLDKISIHHAQESIIVTWLLYKIRSRTFRIRRKGVIK